VTLLEVDLHILSFPTHDGTLLSEYWQSVVRNSVSILGTDVDFFFYTRYRLLYLTNSRMGSSLASCEFPIRESLTARQTPPAVRHQEVLCVGVELF